MAKTSAKGKHVGKRRAVLRGRPPRALAGEVDVRILDAAREVFLERGLSGASVEEIASRARAGKPTIYARFPSKEALFTAVVMRNVDANIARFQSHVPTGPTMEARLQSVGVTVLHWVLASDSVGLMRLGIGEAHRFPDLASSVYRMVRERGARAVGDLLSDAAQSDEFGRLPAFALERLATTTRFFLDLVLLPLLLRALHGERLKTLHTEIDPHVGRSVRFFLAACRHGGVA
jgi:AcrR family transcriptional regulator